MKAIGLIRVSTQAQEFESQSLKVKEAMLLDGFKESEIELIKDKESASKLTEEERSGLNKMKAIIESEQVSSVYVYELSRISRKATMVYSIRDYLVSKKINLVCLNPYFRLLKPDLSFDENSNLAFGVFSTMAENENYVRVQRIMRGKAKKASEGKLTSGKPLYGYSILKDKTLVINPEQAAIVHEIYDRFQSGETCGAIAKDLYLTGVFNIHRLTTVRSYISRILRDKRYTGISPYPQIINTVQFDTCREICQKTKDKFSRVHYTDKDYVCAGLLYTSNGYSMTPSYANNRYSKSNDVEVGSLSVNMRVVDSISIYALKEFLRNGGLKRNKDQEYDIIYKIRERLSQEGRGIVVRMQELEEENARINNRIIKGRMSESEGDKLIDENMSEMQKLEDKRADIEYQVSRLSNQLTYMNSFLYEMDLPPLDTYQMQRDQLRQHLEKIVVSKISWAKFKLTYHWKYNDNKSEYTFYSMNRGVKVWNDKGQEIPLEMK